MKKKGIIKIYYNTWGNANIKNRSWEAHYPNGEIMDYHLKSVLKKEAEEEGYDWEVIRHHRGGGKTILEKSYKDLLVATPQEVIKEEIK